MVHLTRATWRTSQKMRWLQRLHDPKQHKSGVMFRASGICVTGWGCVATGGSRNMPPGAVRFAVWFRLCYRLNWASLVAQTVKNLSAMWRAWVWSLTWVDPLEKGMATHTSVLAWRIPLTEEPGGLQSMESQRVGHHWVTNTHTHTQRDWLELHRWMCISWIWLNDEVPNCGRSAGSAQLCTVTVIIRAGDAGVIRCHT